MWRKEIGATLPFMVLAVFSVLSILVASAYDELIFDEVWYVNAARTFLVNRVCERPEHPPLAQLFIALGMLTFGDTPLGWRFFSVTFSVIALYFYHRLVMDQTLNYDLALSSMIVLAINKLYFTFSTLGVLDIYMLSFIVISIFLASKRRFIESSIFMAISSLCKLASVFYLPILILMVIFSSRLGGERRAAVKSAILWVGVYALTFLVTLSLSDLLYREFSIQNVRNPVDHLLYMVRVHVSSDWPAGVSEKPWLWLFSQNNYYLGGVAFIKNNYLEGTSLAITGLSIASLPYALYKRKGFPILCSIWFVDTYFIWFPTYFLLKRPIFNFYMLPALPAISALNCMFFNGNRRGLWLYVLTCVALFLAFQFPVHVIKP
ncbi:MAG: glycosyltransferase family 39 protein [Candidatus Bathyarchaeia archaeon]